MCPSEEQNMGTLMEVKEEHLNKQSKPSKEVTVWDK
jgi:hypothetical protein